MVTKEGVKVALASLVATAKAVGAMDQIDIFLNQGVDLDDANLIMSRFERKDAIKRINKEIDRWIEEIANHFDKK